MSSDTYATTLVQTSSEHKQNNNLLVRKRSRVRKTALIHNLVLGKRQKKYDFPDYTSDPIVSEDVYDPEATESDYDEDTGDESASWGLKGVSPSLVPGACVPNRTDKTDTVPQLGTPVTRAVTTDELLHGNTVDARIIALNLAQTLQSLVSNRVIAVVPDHTNTYLPLLAPINGETLTETKQGIRRGPNICSYADCTLVVQFLKGGQHGRGTKHGGYPMCTISGCRKTQFFAKGGIRKVCDKHGGKPQCIKNECTLLQARSKKGLARPNEFFCSFHGKEKRHLLEKLNSIHPANLYHYYACLIDVTEQKCSNPRPILGTFYIPTCPFKWHYHNRPNLSKNEYITKWSVEQQQNIEAILTTVFTGVAVNLTFVNNEISVSLNYDLSVRMQS
jgi:hypothetical protein